MPSNIVVSERIISKKPKIYIESPDLIPEVMKSLGARKTQSGWYMPNLMCSIEALERTFPGQIQVTGDLQKRVDGVGFHIGPAPIGKLPPATMKAALSWQIGGMDYLYSTPHKGALIGLSPGLGKTFTAICAAYLMRLRKVLIVCPKNLITNWHAEIRQWVGIEAEVAYREGPPVSVFDPQTIDWVVTNYNTPLDMFDEYAIKWDLIIIDESILLQNRKSGRTKDMTKLAELAKRVWLLSGFPTSKYNDRLYSQLNLIEPGAFSSYWRFAGTYCLINEGRWGTEILGNRPGIDIQKEFRDLMYIRNHSQTLPDLPKIIYQNIAVRLNDSQYKAYVDMSKKFIATWEEEEVQVSNKLASLMKLQQITSNLQNLGEEWPDDSAKTDTLLQLFDAMEIPLPTVIWVHWKVTGQVIAKKLAARQAELKPVHYTGNQAQMDKAISDFKEGRSQVLIMSPGAGKYGFTFTHAKSMVYHDKSWSVDDYVQSLARIDGRIGLQHSPLVISLKCPNTTDDLIEKILRNKAESIAKITSADLTMLLGGLQNDHRRRA